MERLPRKIFFVLFGLLGLAWFAYWQAQTLGSIDERRSNAICKAITPGMTLEKVKAVAAAAKKPPTFGANFSTVGYGACRCGIDIQDNQVVSVGKIWCEH